MFKNSISKQILLLLVSLSFLNIGSALALDYTIPINTENTYINTQERTTTLRQILFSNLMSFNYSKLSVLIDGFQREPRGRMKDARVVLSPYIALDTEFIKLFAHELAHYIDIYVFIPGWGMSDASEDFYHISWQSSTTKHSGQSVHDFVSGYAATNQYEDFAESFVFYVFHNATFADRALKNESLRQKYLFFANSVFPGKSFQGSDFSIGRVPAYSWDTTKIPFSLQKYLYSL